MSHIAEGMEMVQQQHVRKDHELGEETLIPIEARVNDFAEERTYQAQRHLTY